MSFIDDLGDLASSAVDYVKGSNIASGLAKTALLGIALNQMSKSVNKTNDAVKQAPTKNENREQLIPSTKNKIPLVYGTAYVKGIITDAVLASDQKTMFYCIALCEKTGTLISDDSSSSFTIEGIWRNNCKLDFQADGITVSAAADDNGNIDSTVNGLIKVYPFNGDSTHPIFMSGFYSGNSSNAYSIMPNWTSSHSMSGIVFLIISMEYSKVNNVVGLGDITVKVKNSMTLPGDCIYDYMTSTRYGAGITSGEIYSE